MMEEVLLTISQVAKILQMNEAVVRKWLREGKIKGLKLGKEWRIKESDLKEFLLSLDKEKEDQNSAIKKNPYAGCYSYPRWFEYSGLPSYLNEKIGKLAWPIFRKILELYYFHQLDSGDELQVEQQELSEVLGVSPTTIKKYLAGLKKENYIDYKCRNKFFHILLLHPLKTPIPIEKIPLEKGGLKGFPQGKKIGCRIRYLNYPQK